MAIQFIKFHGYGNDYIVIESAQLAEVGSLGEFARRICDRHYGAGADGIAIVGPANDDRADFEVRIFNPDSSEAGLSGNGTRCTAAYLFYQRLWSRNELRLTTRTGLKRYLLREKLGEGKYLFDSELGRPLFASEAIPMIVEPPLERVIDFPLVVAGESFNVTAMQMGNPNCSIFVEDFDSLDWRNIGRLLEVHEAFPDRTNVEFIRILDRQRIELRIWERGVGETTASGTCSCAAAVASMVNGKTDRAVRVLTPGGEVDVLWRDDDEVIITGAAELVYHGQWPNN
jgi:diaminopimelate epimerase